MSNTEIKYIDLGLKNLVKALKDNDFVAKVGILGDSGRIITSQEEGGEGKSNAEIGAMHEFGTTKIPMRSFLRIPVSEKLQKYLDDAGAFNPESVKKIIDQKSFEEFMKKVGLVGETIVLDAFNSGGFGEWKPSNMKYKKNQQTLVETTQLRDSISSEVVND